MKKIEMILIGVFLLNTSAFAMGSKRVGDPGLSGSATVDSEFKKIAQMYDSGTAPTVSDLNGIWSGRCFSRSEPNEALNGGFIFQKSEHSRDVGPIENSGVTYEAWEYSNIDNGPEYFDSLTLQDVLSNYESEFVPIKLESDRAELTVSDKTAAVSFRLSKNYLIMRSSRAGVNQENCYYFIHSN